VKHTKWNLYLVSQSPLVQITKIKYISEGSGFYKVEAHIQNQGFLPTNVTSQAIRNRMAKTVKASISLTNAKLIMGDEKIDLGHLSGHSIRSESPVQKVEWMVKKSGSGKIKASVMVASEKGGTVKKEITLK
jgi:hypothetical protein